MTNSKELHESILEIENEAPQNIIKGKGALELIPYQLFLTELSGNYGALYVRTMLQALNINEHYVLKWRLENKFKQYQILDHYSPGCMPETLSFSKLLNQPAGQQNIGQLFGKGYFLKATLGDASFHTKSWDKTTEFEAIVQEISDCPHQYDSYMLQKKLRLKHEFRIHTFGRDIIPGFSYRIPSTKNLNRHSDAEKFVSKILKNLPDQILQGTLIGWDIGLTIKGEYFVIEANFTGFHPEYRRGFQTTGYVDDHHYGAIICAWLNTYFHKKFGIYIDAVEDSLFLNYPFYSAFVFYMSIFKNEHIDLLENNRHKTTIPVIIYLGEDTNILVVYLIKHFLLVDFAENYYIIVTEKCFSKVVDLFGINDRLIFLTEEGLFTKSQFQLIKQLSYDRRKQICCYHAIRSFKDKSCIVM